MQTWPFDLVGGKLLRFFSMKYYAFVLLLLIVIMDALLFVRLLATWEKGRNNEESCIFCGRDYKGVYKG